MLFSVHVALLVVIAIALARGSLRGRVAALCGLVAVVAAATAIAMLLMSDESRSLDITHSFAAFVGNDLGYKNFAIETTKAGSWAWLAVIAGFGAFWALLLHRLRPRASTDSDPAHPFWAPMLLAWTGTALALGLEKLAGPAELVRPIAFDRALFPATVAAAFLLADRCRMVFLTLSWLSLFVALSRLPIVLFGTVATRYEWGTSLDVHTIQHFANPFVQRTVSVDPGSNDQLGWLIWAPNLLIFPALYMMSSGGVALARLIVLRGAAVGR